MTGLFGPQTSNAVTTKPAGTGSQRFGNQQTWFKDCSGPGASDGTVPNAAFYNRIVGALDYLAGQAGVSGVPGDDSILYRAVLQVMAGNAPAALNTLRELADALGDDPNFASTILTALANRLRFDAGQTLTTAQKAQAVANIGLAPIAVSGSYSDLSGTPPLGTAAQYNVGTTANKIVQLDGSGKLPAIDGSQLTSVTVAAGVLPKLSAVLASDKAITQGAYSDIISVAQGTSGVWLVTATLQIVDPSASSTVYCKMYDGTNLISSGALNIPGSGYRCRFPIVGIITNPAGNIRVAANCVNSTTAVVRASETGLGADTVLEAVRIG